MEGLTTKMQNAGLVAKEEQAFLEKLFDAGRSGNGTELKKLATQYSQDNSIKPDDVLLQCKDADKRTVLHWACQSPKKEEDLVEMLLLSNWLPKASVESLCAFKDKDGITPLMIAARHSDPNVLESRVDAILNVGGPKLALARSRDGATALHYASGAGATPATVRRLVECGKVALETASNKIGPPLLWAVTVEADIDYTETICALLDCGADINAKNEGGFPAVVMAAAAGNDKHAKCLVLSGADRSIILPGNVTLFHMAAEMNLVGTLAALFEMDTKEEVSLAKDYIERKHDEGSTPLDLAAREGHVGCVMLLLPDGENDDEAARVLIAERQAIRKTDRKSTSDADGADQSTSASSDNGIETEARLRALSVSKMKVSDDDRTRAIELKAQGNSAFAKKDWKGGVESYTEAIKADPTDATFYSNRSACYMMLDLPNDALNDAVVARHLRPDWPKACYRLGVARLALELYEDAAVAAWEGVKLDPENEELKSLLQKSVKKGKKAHQESLSKVKKGNSESR